MMKPDRHTPESNDPNVLENILITHIGDRNLEEPCTAQVIERLSPTTMPQIKLEKFPLEILEKLYAHTRKPFEITVKDRRKVQVMRGGWSMGPSTGCVTLRLYKSPCTAIRPDAKISSISFSVINFLQFLRLEDTLDDYKNHGRLLGRTKLVHDDLEISLIQDASFSGHDGDEKKLDHLDGYHITHKGTIERPDGKTFSVKEAESILLGLRTFLSFAAGASCGLKRVKAAYPDGEEDFLRWGGAYVDPWKPACNTWLPWITDRAESLSQAFFGFWALYGDQDWKDVLLPTIDWYVNSKRGALHVGIILIQAALESLCQKITGSKKTNPAGKFLAKAIKKEGLCTAIPSSYRNLDAFFQNHIVPELKKEDIQKDGTPKDISKAGPIAIAELRNDLIHAKKKYANCDNIMQVHSDALRLGQWYTELLLLKQFGYHGCYSNRLAIDGEETVKVPCAKDDQNPN